ncbi:uncharacterized protein BDW47DRAFT_63471 [Aspergillus candidus]|uniref:Uncharacterized protein n=1 Tax=Aspergillus candidus TaxID=41067 RepID=A0A2I2F444_ASPCN|nr:hypothetical protein BDW47DRAFT_63471 [Aspergillus candidus]PLB35404.1 hypothetical protein BDW47DRAFT_63471 [Aspergillus candidus]
MLVRLFLNFGCEKRPIADLGAGFFFLFGVSPFSQASFPLLFFFIPRSSFVVYLLIGDIPGVSVSPSVFRWTLCDPQTPLRFGPFHPSPPQRSTGRSNMSFPRPIRKSSLKRLRMVEKSRS